MDDIWLVVSTPLKNMKVRLDHHPRLLGKINIFPNHQYDHSCRVAISKQPWGFTTIVKKKNINNSPQLHPEVTS